MTPRLSIPRLSAGDTVRLVSPASTPDESDLQKTIAFLESVGLRVEVGAHALDRLGFLAGRDEDRLADLNAAIRDPQVRAIIATRGGRGAYRIADGLDFAALRRDPKPVVGFSEITILHLAIWRACGLPGIHGAAWNPAQFGEASAASFAHALFSEQPVVVASNPDEPTAALTTAGQARGVLLGGNLDMVGTAAGWALPSLDGAILLIEDVEKGLGDIDRTLTRLLKSGCLAGVRGVAVGQFTGFSKKQGFTIIDILRDRLAGLGVPILGGLPLGHGAGAVAVPVGMEAVLDVDGRVLTAKALCGG